MGPSFLEALIMLCNDTESYGENHQKEIKQDQTACGLKIDERNALGCGSPVWLLLFLTLKQTI